MDVNIHGDDDHDDDDDEDDYDEGDGDDDNDDYDDDDGGATGNEDPSRQSWAMHAVLISGDGFIQNRILWVHDPNRFFTTDPKRVNIASGNSK